jgi:signal transduction histidine kinase
MLHKRQELELPGDPQTLEELFQGALAITEELEVRETLTRIVEVARRVTGARFGACGVLGEGGGFVHFIHSGISPSEATEIGDMPAAKGILGMILRADGPVRLDDLSTHPDSTGFPAHHPAMKSFLGMPLIYRDRNVGNIYLTEKATDQPFTEQDQMAVEILAGFAAISITNSHQFHQVNEELEHRRADLDRSNQTLQALSNRVLWMLESERRLIAQELHDGIGQVLTGAILGADAIVEGRGDRDEVAERLRDMLRGAVKDVRRISHGLRPTVLDDLGPVAAVRDIVDQLRGDRSTWISFNAEGTPYRLPEPVETVIFRVAQEALTNAVRHSGAARIESRLEFDPRCVRLVITDNGIGMPPTSAGEGLGLAGMRERASLVNGHLTIDSRPGHGVEVALEVPTD